MQLLLATLQQIAPLEAGVAQQLAACVAQKQVRKGEYLLEIGGVCRNLYWIERGALRGYHLQEDGKEITTWCCFEAEFVLSMYSFVTQTASYEAIQALEDCRLYVLPRESLYALYAQFPSFNVVGRVLMEQYIIELEERSRILQSLPAKERYQYLAQHHPQFVQRVSLGHIASYLGITQETLSRIRGKG